MLLRIRSKDGTFRIETEGHETMEMLLAKIADKIKISTDVNISLSSDPLGKQPLSYSFNDTINSINLRHGDMVFVEIPKLGTSGEDVANKSSIIEDEVDIYLDKSDGLIKRPKDSNFCKHSANGMCDYCMPLEPYDQGYLEEKGIKHMSFHSHLRQMFPKHKRGTSKFDPYSAPLEEDNYKVNPRCSGGHPAWPESICTKCQPSAITLQRQNFRFVDHLEFASATVVDNFIRSWRSTGTQRFGYLLGRHVPYTEVPLGIKAIVEAIYEPPQQNAVDELTVDFTESNDKELKGVAGEFNLKVLGMVYTDLNDKGEGNGKVLCKRHVNSYFMSSQECVFSAEMQLKFPNICRYSKSGKYGSKFVTCIISGNLESDIDIDVYQISNTGMAMVDADIIQPSAQPSKMLVAPATKTRYVPEIFYKFKNEYNVTVKQNAAPSFPTEYLIVNVTHGFPSNPEPLFKCLETFPIENRPNEKSDLSILKVRFELCNLPDALSDFHLLFFLRKNGILTKEEFQLAVQLGISHKNSPSNQDELYQQLTQSPGWMTLSTILNEHRVAQPVEEEEETWACRHCTFENVASKPDCDMCSLPRD